MEDDFYKEAEIYEDEFVGLVAGFRLYLEVQAQAQVDDVYKLAEAWKHDFKVFLEECDYELLGAFNYERAEFTKAIDRIFNSYVNKK